jgi:hypothetical protein
MPIHAIHAIPGPPTPPPQMVEPVEQEANGWAVRPISEGSMSNNPGQWRFTPSSAVPAGHIHIDVNAGGIAEMNGRDQMWMRHEASTPQLQGLAQGLNQAAQHAAMTIHNNQSTIEGRSVHAISHLARWLNPSSKCFAVGAFNCFAKQPWEHWDPTDTPANDCLVQNHCEDAYQQATPVVQQRIEQRAGSNAQRVDMAVHTMAMQTRQGIAKDLGAHAQQAGQVMNDFLGHARAQMIHWGCNAPCATKCTSNIQAYTTCNQCACSHSAVTITANPQGMQ